MIETATLIAGRYRVDARLGGGGMADVFDAYDLHLERPVALKLLRGIDEAGAARRFAEEIRLTARVNHPNIVALFDAGEHDGSPYLVLERVTGGTLAGEMDAGPMSPHRVAAIGEQLASALSHSHAAGIVHRDVKPTNVLLTPQGSVRLADFGIAVTATATRLTVTGTIAGSAGYVSPEQVLGAGAGAPSDIYALGLVLLECLTGAPPWSGTTVEVALARISSDPQIPADLPAGWQPLLAGMTARQPEDRPHIDLVGHALSKLAIDEPYDTSLVAPPLPPDRRVPAVAGMSMLVLLLSAVLVLANGAPDVAIAGAAPTVSVPAAEALLKPAAALAAPEPIPDWVIAQPRTAKAATTSPRAATQRADRRPATRAPSSSGSDAAPETNTTASTTTASAPSNQVADRAPVRTRTPARSAADRPATRGSRGSNTGGVEGDTPTVKVPTTRTNPGTTTNVSSPKLDAKERLADRKARKRREARLRAEKLHLEKGRLQHFDRLSPSPRADRSRR